MKRPKYILFLSFVLSGSVSCEHKKLYWCGYDIIFYNNNRLTIPCEGKGVRTDGGFTVAVDDWGEAIEVPVAVVSYATGTMGKVQYQSNPTIN